MQEQNTKRKKTIPTFIGIAIIVVFALILFGGVFAYQYFFVPEAPVVAPPLQTQDQTAGWKTYINSQYSFEFKYPTDLKVLNDNSGGAYISVWNILSENNDVLVGLSLYSKDTVKSFGWENRKSDDNQAIVKNSNGDMMLITISFDKSDSTKNVFNGVVKTFKFTTPNQNAGWKTYTNTQLGISLQYPSDFSNNNDLSVSQRGSLLTYMGVCMTDDSVRALANRTGFCYIGDQTSDGFAAASFNIIVNNSENSQTCQQIKTSPSRKVTQQVVINGLTFYKDTIENAGLGHYVTGDSYRTYKNGACYTIDLSVESSRGTLEKGLSVDFASMMQSKLKSILSTFKFTTPDQTAGWKTYTDTMGKFEIKYPSNWSAGVSTLMTSVVLFCPPELASTDPDVICKMKNVSHAETQAPIIFSLVQDKLQLNENSEQYTTIFNLMNSSIKFAY